VSTPGSGIGIDHVDELLAEQPGAGEDHRDAGDEADGASP